MSNKEDVDKLIELALQEPKKDELALNDVDRWLIASGIKAGNHAIPPKKLYALYKLWAPKPIKYLTFCKQLRKHFQKKYFYVRVYYLVDGSTVDFPLQLEEDLKNEFIAGYKKRNNARYALSKAERLKKLNNNE